VALLFVAAFIVVGGTLFLMMVETAGTPLQVSRERFVGLVFEAASAFGTVGLSTGVTPGLTAAAKLCLVGLMFLGRVGPLGLISATLRGGAKPDIGYPSEDVQIG
jgi:trk system potassium uptake protein TrkH